MKKRLGIEIKIAGAVLVVIAGYALSMGVNAWQGQRADARLAELSSISVPAALESQAALFAFEDAMKRHEDALLTGDEEGLPAVERGLAQVVTLLATEAGRSGAADDNLQIAIGRVELVKKAALPLFKDVAARGMGDAQVQEAVAGFRSATVEARKVLSTLSETHAAALRGTLDHLVVTARRQRVQGFATFGVVVAVGGLAAFLIVRRGVVRPVLDLSHELGDEAAGVKQASDEFGSASRALASGASESAATLETSSAALEQIAGVTRANATRAQEAKTLAARARQAADDGGAGMLELRSAMSAIQEASNNIAAILKTIDEIAFQTNILALNAAVEAARAGDAGAGFAVVADEVRTLAQRSAQAAKDTAAKIEQATTSSRLGGTLSEKVATHLTEIGGRVRDVDEIIAQIAAASQEQSTGVDHVARNMSELEGVTQRNAALADETLASANALEARTQRLREVTTAFTVLAKGGISPVHTEAPVEAHERREVLPAAS